MAVLSINIGTPSAPDILQIPGGGNVSAAANLTDNAVLVGDGGAKGIKTTPLLVDAATGVLSIPGIGDGGLTSYDLKVGDTTTPDYGMIQIGNAAIGRTSYNAGAKDYDGTLIFRNLGGPVTGEIEVAFSESTGDSCRFAIAKSAVGNATYNSRSMLIAGPAPANTDFVKVSYWQGQGIFDNLACDTAGDGADLGVQNDLEVEGDIFTDSLKESTPAAGITVADVLKLGDDLELGSTVHRVLDNLGNEILIFLRVASAVNYLQLRNAATGGDIKLLALGGDTNIGIDFVLKGNETLKSGGVAVLLNILEDATPELGGELDAGAHTIGFTLQTATGDGTTTIDWKLGNKMKFTFGAQNDTFTFTAPTNPCNLILHMKQDATGSRDATWPAAVTWLGDEPTWTDGGANKTLIASFWYDGTTYWGQGTAWET